MPDTLSFRHALPPDIDALCALADDVNALHHGWSPECFPEPGDAARFAAYFERTLGDPTSTTMVACRLGVVLGFVTLFLEDSASTLNRQYRRAKVDAIAVESRARSLGIGTRLMATAERWAGEQGASEVYLSVWENNCRGQRLYMELGYQVRSRTMSKRIGPTTST